MRRRDGSPIWIKDGTASLLKRADLGNQTSGFSYDEAWLQNLLHKCPTVFPVEQIEPGFGELIPVCMELPVVFGTGRSGALDNVFTTREGRLVLIEAKLWRNPEARRSVVAQVMEYAAAIFRMNYEQLDDAVRRANRVDGQNSPSLFELVKQKDDHVDEAEFIDAVSLNLRRGRAILGVVGDGIREDIEPLSELLQSHAGHRFTFALVELAVFAGIDGDSMIVTPSVLAKTALIERGVVQISEGPLGHVRVEIEPSRQVQTETSRTKSISIGEDEFYELLDQRSPGSSIALKEFLDKASDLGIRPERQSGLNLKHPMELGNALNLATIDKGGFIDTAPSSWWGRTEIGKRYNERLAALIGGFVRDIKSGTESAVRTSAGKMPRVSDFLPQHGDAWLEAMSLYLEDAFRTDR